jgi:hypothetical protein
MTRQWWRELRELRGATLVALLAMTCVTASCIMPQRTDPHEAPFLAGVEELIDHPGAWMWSVAAVGLGLGALQGMRDGPTYDRRSVLAHRAVGAGRLAAAKLLSGWAALAIAAGIPLLLAALWNATLAPRPFVPASLIIPALLLAAGCGCQAAGLAAASGAGPWWGTRLSLPLAAVIMQITLGWLMWSWFGMIPLIQLAECAAAVLVGAMIFAWGAWAEIAAHGDQGLVPASSRWIRPLATAMVLSWCGVFAASSIQTRVVNPQEVIDGSSYVFSDHGGVAVDHIRTHASLVEEDSQAAVRPLDPSNPLDVAAAAPTPPGSITPVSPDRSCQYERPQPGPACLAIRVDARLLEDRNDPTHAMYLYANRFTGTTSVRSLDGGRAVTLPVRAGDPPFPTQLATWTESYANQAIRFHYGIIGTDGRPWWWEGLDVLPHTTPGPWTGGTILELAEYSAEPGVMHILADDGTLAIGSDGLVQERLPSPLPLSHFAWFHLAPAVDSGVWLASTEEPSGPVTLRHFDRAGTLRSTRMLPALPPLRWENPSLVGRVVCALLPPMLGPLDLEENPVIPGHIWQDGHHQDALWKRWWWRVAVNAVLAAAVGGMASRRSLVAALGWGLLVLGFGICGACAVALHVRLPRRAPCPHCSRPRPVNLSVCGYCAGTWVQVDLARIIAPVSTESS